MQNVSRKKQSEPVVIAIHPVPAEKIMAGEKRYELRTRFPNVAVGTNVYLYATAPLSAVVGGFTVASIEEDSVGELWRRIGSFLGITRSELDRYTRGRDKAKAIGVDKPFRLSRHVSRGELQSPPHAYCPPQSSSFLRLSHVRTLLEGLRLAPSP